MDFPIDFDNHLNYYYLIKVHNDNVFQYQWIIDLYLMLLPMLWLVDIVLLAVIVVTMMMMISPVQDDNVHVDDDEKMLHQSVYEIMAEIHDLVI